MTSEEIRASTAQHVMHTYNRLPMVFVRGEGVRVWDAEGKEYLDFLAGLGVNNLGHCHPRVVAAIRQQAGELLHVSNLYHIAPQARLAEMLAKRSGFERVFFCNSGAEANEAAIKLARRYAKKRGHPERYEVITALRSFHGRTLATVAATGQPKYHQGFEPLPAGFRHVPLNDVDALDRAITEATCAVMLEPIQGEGGIYPCTREYLEAVRERTAQRDLVLIFDEVQCGMGRTGRFFAFEHAGVRPDVVTMAKALAGGVPIGAVLATGEAATGFDPGSHASTFGGNPLACAAGVATLEAMDAEGVIEHAAEMGEYFMAGLHQLGERMALRRGAPVFKEIRGRGLMIGCELTIPATPVFQRCLREGLLLNVIDDRILRFLPPLIVQRPEIDQALRILEGAVLDAVAA
ncbi:MAG TPA: acetylornithine transaminase [Limnochordia bacterium]